MKRFLIRQLLLTLILCILPKPYAQSKPLILLCAQGDAQTPGRKIRDSFEREQAHAFIQALGKYLHTQEAYALALTHEPSDKPETGRLISLSNKFNPDLFIKIYLTHTSSPKPLISLFYLTLNPLTEAAYRTDYTHSLIPLKRAHIPSLQITKHYATCLKTALDKTTLQKKFTLCGPYGIPILSLVGITAPALAIELGINTPDQWKELIKPLAKSLSFLIKPGKNIPHE